MLTGITSPVVSTAVGSSGGGGSSTLLTDLVSWWSLDETSGTRYDSVASTGHDLSDNNTVTSATGKVSNAGQFTKANAESLSIASGHTISASNGDFSAACWVYADTLDSAAGILNCGSDSNNHNNNWLLYYSYSVQRFQFYIPYSPTWHKVDASTLGAPVINTWYLLIVSYTASTKEMAISVNNGAVDTAIRPTTLTNLDAKPFKIGSYSSPALYWDGRVDGVAYWSRVLTSDERTELYNSGNGIGYPG